MSRVTQDTTRPHFDSYTGLSPSMIELSRTFYSRSEYHGVVLQPRMCIATHTVWALPRSLATTGGIISYFLFLEVLRCFSSLRSPIRKSRDQRLFAPTPSLSQLITSFIASVSQGIRHAPLTTFANVYHARIIMQKACRVKHRYSSYYQLLIHII